MSWTRAGRINTHTHIIDPHICRWHNQLNPDINKAAWTPEEEAVILKMQEKIGNKWAEVGLFKVPGLYFN